jgi:hypothetical protein
MQKITGRLIFKSLMKVGTNEFGEWKIVNFVLQKTFQKKKYNMLFVAKGKRAKFIESVPYKERLTVHYVIDSKEYKPSKWATDLIAVEIEKYAPTNPIHVRFGEQEYKPIDPEINPDLQLDFNKKNDEKGGGDAVHN